MKTNKATSRKDAFFTCTYDKVKTLSNSLLVSLIVPSDPATLPTHLKATRINDLVVDTSKFLGKKFGVHVYLAELDFDEHRLLSPPAIYMLAVFKFRKAKMVFAFDAVNNSESQPWPHYHSVSAFRIEE
jgi:hypothetical protein